MPAITSRSNETIKAVVRLAAKRDDQHLVLEGPHLVGEALVAGLALELVLVTEAALADPDLIAMIPRLPIQPTTVAPGLLDPIADADSPRGVVAVARRPLTALPDPIQRGLYLDGVQDPGNLGALARVLEAAGGDALLLGPGCAHPHHPRALRASAGSLLRLAWQRFESPASAHQAGGATPWWGLDGGADSDLLWDLASPADGHVILALGAEGPGLSPAARRCCSRLVRIPLATPVESLNVATAAAVALFELIRRRRGR